MPWVSKLCLITASGTDLDLPCLQEIIKARKEARPKGAVLGHVAVPVDLEDLLIRRLLLLLDRGREHERKRAARREQVVRDVLGRGRRHGVVDDLDRVGGDLLDLRLERVVGEVAVEDVRSPDLAEPCSVAGRRGGDDGTKSGHLEQLDGCLMVCQPNSIVGVCVMESLPYWPTELAPPNTMIGWSWYLPRPPASQGGVSPAVPFMAPSGW